MHTEQQYKEFSKFEFEKNLRINYASCLQRVFVPHSLLSGGDA